MEERSDLPKKTKVTFKFNCLDDEMIKIEESEDA